MGSFASPSNGLMVQWFVVLPTRAGGGRRGPLESRTSHRPPFVPREGKSRPPERRLGPGTREGVAPRCGPSWSVDRRSYTRCQAAGHTGWVTHCASGSRHGLTAELTAHERGSWLTSLARKFSSRTRRRRAPGVYDTPGCRRFSGRLVTSRDQSPVLHRRRSQWSTPCAASSLAALLPGPAAARR